jgi:hypothetical protein
MWEPILMTMMICHSSETLRRTSFSGPTRWRTDSLIMGWPESSKIIFHSSESVASGCRLHWRSYQSTCVTSSWSVSGVWFTNAMPGRS